MDQSTVSRRIAQLEFTLGASIFERGHTGLSLNSFGHHLLTSVEAMDTGFTSLTAALDHQTSELQGPVRIGTMEGIATLYLSRHFVDFNQTYPKVTVELVTSPQQLFVTRREADAFLGFFKPNGLSLDAEQMGRFVLHLYTSDGYLERYGSPSSVQELEQHQFVGYIDDLIEIDAVKWLEEVSVKTIYDNSAYGDMEARDKAVKILRNLSYGQQAAGDGDLTRRLPVTSKDELGALSHSFNQFVEKIHGLVRQIVEMTQQLTTLSKDMSSQAQQSEEAMERQRNETDQVATAIHEMSAAAHEISNSAQGAAQAAKKIDDGRLSACST